MSTKNTFIAIFAVLVLALIFGKGEEKPMAQWSYTEDGGAKEWAELDERYAMCAQGQNQSPINIVNPIDAKLEELKFESNSKAATFVNNGHAIQANFAAGTSVTIDGEKYALKQVRFHTPSENTINGKSFPMEAHFVHQKGKSSLAVVAVMFEKGEDNPVLNKLLRNLPEEEKASNVLKSEIKGYELLPASKEYYRYNGSLTTPPCTEGVKWIVLKNPVSVSESQLKDFKNVMPKNNRPVQDLNARTILN